MHACTGIDRSMELGTRLLSRESGALDANTGRSGNGYGVMLRGAIQEPEPHMEGSAMKQGSVAVRPSHDQGPLPLPGSSTEIPPGSYGRFRNRRVAVGKPSEDPQLW